MRLELGDEVRDVVTGYQGIIVTRSEFLNKCVRHAVQSQELKDGKPVDSQYFDEEQLEIVTAQKIRSPKVVQTGGPRDVPSAVRRPPSAF